MDNKLFGLFSGRQITTMVVAAIVAPTVVWGAATFTPVVIQDGTTNVRATVDASHRLNVVDQFADYIANPSNYVRFSAFGGGGTCTVAYTVPAGKGLVLTAMSSSMVPGSGTVSTFSLYTGTSGAPCTTYLVGATSSQPSQTVAQTFGQGIKIPPGSVVSAINSNDVATTIVFGYLVPAGAAM